MNRRLLKEFKTFKASKEKTFYLYPKKDDILIWHCLILGPNDTPYKNGYFELQFYLTSEYPLKPPKAKFLTKIFHPNVHWEKGEVCIDILSKNWSPCWTLTNLVRAIIALLCDPYPDSPLNCDAGNLLRLKDLRGYDSLAKMYTHLCASRSHVRRKYHDFLGDGNTKNIEKKKN